MSIQPLLSSDALNDLSLNLYCNTLTANNIIGKINGQVIEAKIYDALVSITGGATLLSPRTARYQLIDKILSINFNVFVSLTGGQNNFSVSFSLPPGMLHLVSIANVPNGYAMASTSNGSLQMLVISSASPTALQLSVVTGDRGVFVAQNVELNVQANLHIL